MVLTRAGVKALAVERRRRCIMVTKEVEDPSIPDLGEQKTAKPIVKFVEKHGILDCKSVIKKGGLLKWHLVNMRSWPRGRRRRPSEIPRKGAKRLSPILTPQIKTQSGLRWPSLVHLLKTNKPTICRRVHPPLLWSVIRGRKL
ncbi:hypothetical protein SESBI_18503 [Sesbania bispinosa]|nr:hypothetical protein SESBI_18503 [Sesbania bispinosa]